jgi:hypothetical protein
MDKQDYLHVVRACVGFIIHFFPSNRGLRNHCNHHSEYTTKSETWRSFCSYSQLIIVYVYLSHPIDCILDLVMLLSKYWTLSPMNVWLLCEAIALMYAVSVFLKMAVACILGLMIEPSKYGTQLWIHALLHCMGIQHLYHPYVSLSKPSNWFSASWDKTTSKFGFNDQHMHLNRDRCT